MQIAKGTKRKLLEEVNGRCFYCGCKLVDSIISFDHIVAKSKGGNGTKRNMCACCRGCNSIKNYSKSIEGFREIMQESQEVEYYEFYFEKVGLDKYGESYPPVANRDLT